MTVGVIGNMGQIFTRHALEFIDVLASDYGGVSKIHGMFNVCSKCFSGGACGLTFKAQSVILHVYDPTALQHMLVQDSHIFEEPQWLLA